MLYNSALDSFIMVADCKSFTKAAESLYISHTAVIKQINVLEAQIGAPLLVRSNHGVRLTAAGAYLYAKAKEMIRFSEQAMADIQALQMSVPKTIRVGASLFYPCHVFMDLWDKVSSLCPQYQLKIVPIEDDAKRFAGLNEKYDLIVGPYNSENKSGEHTFIPVGTYRFTLAVPRQHPLAKRKSTSFSALSGERLMIMRMGTSAINDSIRREVMAKHPDIVIEDISPQYSLSTFNDCMEQNAVLLSLECWNNVHPAITAVTLEEQYEIPYGILTAKKTSAEVKRFVHALKVCLSSMA